MSAMTRPVQPPPGAPPEWPLMPWSARQRWIARTRPHDADEDATGELRTELSPAPPTVQECGNPKLRPGDRTREETLRLVLEMAGESPQLVCARLESSPAAIAKALQRTGRPDLARPFERLRRRDWAATERRRSQRQQEAS